MEIDGVDNIHHIHIWSIDGYNNYATMHIVSDKPNIKELVKEELKEHGICHSTIELEKSIEVCNEEECDINNNISTHSHHHH